jgi:hypothetical protein
VNKNVVEKRFRQRRMEEAPDESQDCLSCRAEDDDGDDDDDGIGWFITHKILIWTLS